jgi:hypothetical protein
MSAFRSAALVSLITAIRMIDSLQRVRAVADEVQTRDSSLVVRRDESCVVDPLGMTVQASFGTCDVLRFALHVLPFTQSPR